MHFNEMLAFVHDLTDESETAPSFHTNPKVARYINLAHRSLIGKIISTGGMHLLRRHTFSLVAAQETYTLPRIHTIHRLERTDQTPAVEIVPAELRERFLYEGNSSTAPDLDDMVYHLSGTTLYLLPTPASALANGMRLWYEHPGAGLHAATSSAGSTTSITFPATPTTGELTRGVDEYVGYIVNTTGGTGSGQQAVVTAYNQTTRVATAAFAPAPDNTTIYTLESPLPEQYHELIAFHAALMAHVRSDDDLKGLSLLYKEGLGSMLFDMETQHADRPRHVISVTEESA